MSAALAILNGHRYCPMGGAPAICADARGWPTNCTWKPRRGQRADGMAVQHMRHVADLIDSAYSSNLLDLATLLSVRDHVTEALELDRALGYPDGEFQRGQRHALKEMAQILGFEEVRL